MRNGRANVFDVKLRAAGGRPASSGAPLAAHPIMPMQVARRRANSRRGSRLGRRKKRGRTVNFNAELAGLTLHRARGFDFGPIETCALATAVTTPSREFESLNQCTKTDSNATCCPRIERFQTIMRVFKGRKMGVTRTRVESIHAA